MKTFDAIIIGSGQGGTPLAKKLAGAGWNTALVERRLIGGTCINDGCTPTKAMIACAQAAFTAANSRQWGIDVTAYQVDMEYIVQRKNRIVQQFRSSAENGLQETKGLTLIYGRAAFTGARTLEVQLEQGGSETISAAHIFINTGAAPQIPDIAGLRDVPYLTSTSLLDVKTLPRHLLVLGGGYVGLEFAQLFRRLGSEVTLVQKGPQLLAQEDADVAAAVQKILEEDGITIYTNATAKQVEQAGINLALQITAGERPRTLTGSHLLVATGRVPQTAALQLQRAGVSTDPKGHITVNDRLETSAPGIYAIGDVKGGPAFTHISYNDHLLLYGNLVEQASLSASNRQVPYCMFTDPQLGRIGFTESEARKQGYRVKVARLEMDKVARAIETGATRGFMKAVVEEDTGRILGAAILGREGGEVMSVLQMAMLGGITAPQVRNMVFAHPLFTESLNNLFMTLGN